MLKLLKVKNFALLEDLTIEFESGLTVITGETGAGKSMIVEAVATLCGNRMEEVLIRSSKNFAEVTGIFSTTPVLKKKLEKAGIETDSEMIIRRKIERGRRQNAYINDQIVSLNLLREISRETIDLIGQYEHQSLFYPKNHLVLLDSFAGVDNLKKEYNTNYSEYRRLQGKLQELLEAVRQKDERVEYLRYQIDEIEKANIQPGEEDELLEEQNLLVSSEKRTILSTEIVNRLYEADGSIIENLAAVKKLFDDLCEYDPKLSQNSKELETVISSIDEIYRQISSYREQIEFSETRLDYVQGRLETITKIKKKYGKSLDEVYDYLLTVKKELSMIETRDEEISRLKNQITDIEKKLMKQADELSARRQRAAESLRKKILNILSQLGMKKADFEISINHKELGENGKDDIEFYISTNPGEELKPLRKVASGGETSRIILGLKTILSEVDKIPTIIFDEVDTGIGGGIAEAVGDLLAKISRRHQIICITHLPQISIFADSHILVEKEIKGKETFTKVTKLDKEKRKQEVARMLGGREITEKTIEHAAEFLERRRKR